MNVVVTINPNVPFGKAASGFSQAFDWQQTLNLAISCHLDELSHCALITVREMDPLRLEAAAGVIGKMINEWKTQVGPTIIQDLAVLTTVFSEDKKAFEVVLTAVLRGYSPRDPSCTVGPYVENPAVHPCVRETLRGISGKCVIAFLVTNQIPGAIEEATGIMRDTMERNRDKYEIKFSDIPLPQIKHNLLTLSCDDVPISMPFHYRLRTSLTGVYTIDRRASWIAWKIHVDWPELYDPTHRFTAEYAAVSRPKTNRSSEGKAQC